MESLDRAIDLVSRWKADRAKPRAEVLARLEDVAGSCQEAIRVWQEFLDQPGAPGDRWTIMSWTGPERAKRLHEINLKAKQGVEEVCRLAGPAAGRFAALEDEDVIEMAYRQLQPDETGPDAARAAIEKTRARLDYLEALMARVRSAKPAASGGGAKQAKKKAPAKPAKKKKPAPKKK